MESAERPPTPQALLEHAETWTRAWLTRRATNPAARFSWPSLRGAPLNRVLLDPLRAMTRNHCAYCDGFPVGAMSRETIDHFRPKSDPRFAELAFEWSNLFLACDRCQAARREQFVDLLLKPDDIDYTFERYFLITAHGELRPNPAATAHDRDRADKTIALLALNAQPLPLQRLRFMRAIAAHDTFTADAATTPYRFLHRIWTTTAVT